MLGYIYRIRYPLTLDVVYIGCSTNIVRRMEHHLKGKSSNNKLKEWTLKLLQDNIKPLIDIIDSSCWLNVHALEMKHIKKHFEMGFNLFNRKLSEKYIFDESDFVDITIQIKKSLIENDKIKSGFSAYIQSLINYGIIKAEKKTDKVYYAKND